MVERKLNLQRGDIILLDLDPIKGHEQGGERPCVIIQNDIGNKFSPLTIIAPITSSTKKKDFPTSVFLPKELSGLNYDSIINCSQIRVIDKSRIINKLTKVDKSIYFGLDKALKVSLALN